jgi:methyltransferase family protein
MSALYDQIGTTYSRYRRPDARIAAAIGAALDGCSIVLSVGAGTGSYEPQDCALVAIEPSRTMIAQRAPGSAPVVQGVAEHLPFVDGMYDAALAILTVHHWLDATAGLAEMRRVSSRQVVLTWDPAISLKFWLVTDYLPEIVEHEEFIATLGPIREGLATSDVRAVPVPWDCTDGFMGSYWRRPERYLDPGARAAISGISLLDQRTVDRAMRQLAADLADGTWERRHADLLALEELDLGYRLVVADH